MTKATYDNSTFEKLHELNLFVPDTITLISEYAFYDHLENVCAALKKILDSLKLVLDPEISRQLIAYKKTIDSYYNHTPYSERKLHENWVKAFNEEREASVELSLKKQRHIKSLFRMYNHFLDELRINTVGLSATGSHNHYPPKEAEIKSLDNLIVALRSCRQYKENHQWLVLSHIVFSSLSLIGLVTIGVNCPFLELVIKDYYKQLSYVSVMGCNLKTFIMKKGSEEFNYLDFKLGSLINSDYGYNQSAFLGFFNRRYVFAVTPNQVKLLKNKSDLAIQETNELKFSELRYSTSGLLNNYFISRTSQTDSPSPDMLEAAAEAKRLGDLILDKPWSEFKRLIRGGLNQPALLCDDFLPVKKRIQDLIKDRSYNFPSVRLMQFYPNKNDSRDFASDPTFRSLLS